MDNMIPNYYGFTGAEDNMLRNMDNQVRQQAYNRRYNNTQFTPGSFTAYGPRTATGYANKMSEIAQNIVNSPEAPNWGSNSPTVPKGVPAVFANKWKCNAFPAYLANAINPQSDLFRNGERGDLISAKQIRRGIDNPASLKGVYNGQIVPVPEHLIPYATGALLSRRNKFGSHHTGIITDKGTTVSPSTDSLVHNMFGFRDKQQALDGDSVTAAWYLPKGMNGDELIQNAQQRYVQDLPNIIFNRPRVVPREVYDAEVERAHSAGHALPNITYQGQPYLLREINKRLYKGRDVQKPGDNVKSVDVAPSILNKTINTNYGIF